MDRSRESHWQQAWADARLGEGHRVPGREKFYAIVAYPGTSGFLHLGHLRGLAYTDALLRFYRAQGRSVFFPTGAHATGLPAVTFAQKVANRDPLTVQQLTDNGVPAGEWAALEDPAHAARFLGRSYLDVFRRMGVLLDETAYVTTIDEDYQAFIRWQFGRLNSAGALIQKPHFAAVCPVCGPVSVDLSETDLSKGGDAETVTYTTLPFRMDDGRVLLAATLRPETVYGVTNLWVPAEAPLVVWHQPGPHGETEVLVSEAGARRLVEQHGGRIGATTSTDALEQRTAVAPITGARVPVFRSPLVDPTVGSGVVMSVPGHAPVDWLGVSALPPSLRSTIGAIPELIELPASTELSPSERQLIAGEGSYAERAARATGARSIADTAQLEEATERLYRLEYVRGRMRPELEGGIPVAEARDVVGRRLGESGAGLELRAFSKDVVCRNGHEVVIRRIPDQWFIHYGDAAWKRKTRDLVDRLTVVPRPYQEELSSILDWLGDRPCTRRGRWLGTPFPLDPSWLIEPIADSTLYPAYFPVRRFVAHGSVPLSALTPAFFDYVLLGEGTGEPSLDPAVQKEVRDEFLYWYPLDVNVGGKEHKRVHFPVFLATHALLVPVGAQPRGLFVHWWLTNPGGGKISKKEVSSKGGRIPPIGEALAKWGADALRLYLVESASPDQDIEWDPALVDAVSARIAEFERLARDTLRPGGDGPPELDRWLESELHDLVRTATRSFASFEFRAAAQVIYVRVPTLVRRYLARGGIPGPALQKLGAAWVRLMAPITPHVAEEVGAEVATGLIAQGPFPRAEEYRDAPESRTAEAYLATVEADLRSVVRAQGARGEAPSEVVFYVAAPWKRPVEAWLREAVAEGRPLPTVREVMERASHHPELAGVRPEIAAYVPRIAASVRSEGGTAVLPADEDAVLRGAEGYLSRRFGFKLILVVPEQEAESHDPKGRRQRARPGRPAFYFPERGVARASSTPPPRTA